MVDVQEWIHTRQHIRLWGVDHTIDYTTCASRCSDLTCIHNIEREGVVWLVSCAIRDWCTLFYTQFLSYKATCHRLHTYRRGYIGEHLHRDTIIVGNKLSDTLLLEVPKDSLRETRVSCRHHTRQFIGDIISRQHSLIYRLKELWLIALHPRQFRGCEVTR